MEATTLVQQRRPLGAEDSKEGLPWANHRRKAPLHLAQPLLLCLVPPLHPLLPLPRLRLALHPPLHLEPLWRCRTLPPLRLLMRLLVVVLSAHPGQVLLWGGLLDWVQAAGHSEQAQ